MQLTAKLKLECNGETAQALFRTMATVNAACSWLSEQVWASRVFGRFAMQKKYYAVLKEVFPALSAQAAIHVVRKVADAYQKDKKTLRKFESLGSITYDLRILSWKKGSVSIWTVNGRKKIPFVCGERQREQIKTQHGETDLLLQDGQLYLATCCDAEVPEVDTLHYTKPLGVDLGVANLATDSDGHVYPGSKVKNIRCRHRRLRTALQKCGTKSAKRHLKKLSGKEARFARDTNHVISKQIVAKAKRTVRGIAVEELTGIRERIRARRRQRAVLHSWSFFQLRQFLEYKAALAGVPMVAIDPRHTSCECSACGYIDKANRKTQKEFCCLRCGYTALADHNAARVIASRAYVSTPIAAMPEMALVASPRLWPWGC